MNEESNLKKSLNNLLLLKAKVKGTSYLEELRLLKYELEERAKNKKVIDKDESVNKNTLG